MKEAQLKQLKDHLYQKEEIIFAYIYGSVARNQDTKLSDIDITIYIDEDKRPEAGPFGYRSELITELQPLAGNDIDLIILNEASNLLAYNVFKEGRKEELLESIKLIYKMKFDENISDSLMDDLEKLETEKLQEIRNRIPDIDSVNEIEDILG